MPLDSGAVRVKNKYGDAWRTELGAHMISVFRGPDGDYLRVSIDPSRPLPVSGLFDGVKVEFAHAERARPL